MPTGRRLPVVLVMLGLLVMTMCFGSILTVSIPDDQFPGNRTLTIGLLGSFTYHWYLGTQDVSAIVPAIEDIMEYQLLPGYQIEWTWRENDCQPLIGFRNTIEVWQTEEDLDVIIGASCSAVCEPVALLAATWNIPAISPGCTSPALSDKETYPTFTRVVGTEDMLAPLVNAILDTLDWGRCAILTTPDDLHSNTAKEIKRVVEAAGKQAYYHVINEVMDGDEVNADALAAQVDIVRLIREEARFVVLLMLASEIRVVLLSAYDEGMLNGDYIFLGNEMLQYIDKVNTYRSHITNEMLFTGFLWVAPLDPAGEAWNQLAEEVVEAFDDPHFDGYNDELISPANFYAATLYEAVLLWAHGVNRTLEDGGLPDDGLSITRNILNYTFEGISGPVAIDYKGDRKIERVVSIVQPGLEVVELFHWHASIEELERVYVSETGGDDWSGLVWAGGATTIPSGVPDCGWDGELCIPPPADHTNSIVAAIMAAGVAICTAVAAIYFYKRQLRHHEEEELMKLFVSISDIVIWKQVSLPEPDGELFVKDAKHVEMKTSQVFSDEEKLAILDSGQTVVGQVRECRVAIRAYRPTGSAAPSASLLAQVRAVKRIQHDNVNAFVAVCPAPSARLLVLMEHASRGSLRDLLADPSIHFLWDMKVSFMSDIIRGLRYLHRNELSQHGRLTSSNCVINKRWTCRLTDYGFASLRQGVSGGGGDLDEACLWKAPEILRQVSGPSKEGDMYAFGIIMQELLTRELPFAYNRPELSLAETISRVKNPTSSMYRPVIPDSCPQSCKELAESCWAEDPDIRPSSSEILKEIARINGGSIPQLVDRIIQNLDRHTRKLEEIVAERSAELLAEKATMSALLSELLPQNVCEQLQLGRHVQPEHYDCVTVCFTDLVGFTQAAACLSPLEVVQMLNSLYLRFDDVINRYDVYKVATIGDAYVVASGVPLRNGDAHAYQIARMSIDLIEVMQNASDLSQKLEMRVGVHSGPCVAGVTGTKTPRYLLFGETIDVGARIEAGGQAMQIHISEATVELLESHTCFEIIARGPMEIKGVGTVNTSWLLGMQNNSNSIQSLC